MLEYFFSFDCEEEEEEEEGGLDVVVAGFGGGGGGGTAEGGYETCGRTDGGGTGIPKHNRSQANVV